MAAPTEESLAWASGQLLVETGETSSPGSRSTASLRFGLWLTGAGAVTLDHVTISHSSGTGGHGGNGGAARG